MSCACIYIYVFMPTILIIWPHKYFSNLIGLCLTEVMPQLEDACTAVNGTIGCCHIVSYTVQLGQYRLAVFETGIIMLTLFSILFLLFKLRSTLEIHISLYYNFVLLATFTYVAVVVINLLPKPAADGSALYYAWLVRIVNTKNYNIYLSVNNQIAIFFFLI
jgi:hypothetical protein